MQLEIASRDILYHNTSGFNAFHALKSMTFKLPFSETNSSESQFTYQGSDGKRKVVARAMPYLHYISLARTLASGYIADRGPHLRGVNNAITFVLDGKRLQSLNRKTIYRSVNYYDTDKSGRQMSAAKEAEERLYSDERTISIKGVVKSILICIRKGHANQWDRMVYSFCLKHKIPVKLFTLDNIKGFLRQKENPEDREAARQTLLSTKFEKSPGSYNSEAARKFYNARMPEKDRRYSDYTILEQLTRIKDFSKLSPQAQSLARESASGYYNSRGIVQYYESYIHNLRGNDRRDETSKIRALVKKMGAKSLTEFFQSLENKWKKILQE